MKMSREQVSLLLIVVLVLGSSGLYFFQKMNNRIVISGALSNLNNSDSQNYSLDNLNNNDNNAKGFNNEITADSVQKQKNIIIHVAGEVNNPGVYELLEGSRIIDAVEVAAGGTEYADLDALNLAALVYDGEKIYIPSIFETAQNEGVDSLTESNQFRNQYSGSNKNDMININIANVEELMKLSGIGPSKAKSIIDFREKIGRFEQVEDLLEVSGIGEKTLEKIKDQITTR